MTYNTVLQRSGHEASIQTHKSQTWQRDPLEVVIVVVHLRLFSVSGRYLYLITT
jgi:hypothetical protein